MGYISETANLQDYALSKAYENIELIIYSALCFFVPFFIGHPQIFAGIAVNAVLVTAALNLKGYKLLPVIMIPSLGVLSRGIVFGPFSKFLIYMIPFIWFGNALLVFSFKHFKLKKKYNFAYTLMAGAIIKSGFLFLSAFILYKLSIIPVIFLTAMGFMQFATAVSGGIAAYGIHSAKKKIL